MELVDIGILWVFIGASLVVLMQAQALRLARINRSLAESEAALRKRNGELDTANAKLREIGSIKDRLLANMTRELRAPLDAIQSVTGQLTECEAEGTPRPADAIPQIEREAGRLARMIDTLLELVRLESQSVAWSDELVSIDTVCRRAVANIEGLAKSRQVSVVVELDDHLPPIWADEERLVQMITLLLESSLTCAVAGGTVTTSARADGDEITFTIDERRNGRGATMPRASAAPTSAEHEAADTSGVGLGLSLCRQIADRHQGKVWAESSLGKSTTFSARIAGAPRNGSESHA